MVAPPNTPVLSQFKLGLLEGIEAMLTNRPTDWRASGVQGPKDDRFWTPTVDMLADFNRGIEAGFSIARAAKSTTEIWAHR